MITERDLKYYKYLLQEIDLLEEGIKAIETRLMTVSSPRVDGMPHAHTVTDGADLIAVYIDQQESLGSRLRDAIKLRAEIEKAVDALPATECMAIKCRYLFDMTIFKVAAEMNYSESQVKRIIKSGLKRLEEEK